MRILHAGSSSADGGDVASGEVVVAVSRDELRILANGVNEALELLEPWEFPIRVGAGTDEAKVLRAQLAEVRRA